MAHVHIKAAMFSIIHADGFVGEAYNHYKNFDVDDSDGQLSEAQLAIWYAYCERYSDIPGLARVDANVYVRLNWGK